MKPFLSGLSVPLLLMGVVAAAGETGVDTAAARRQFVEQQIAAGEFGSARATASLGADVAEQSELLGQIAHAQIQAGDFDAALGTVRSMPSASSRTQGRVQRAEQQSLSGGTGADFDTLIDLIQRNTSGPWEDIDGVGGPSPTPYETGVRVDPRGLLGHLSQREVTGRLKALGSTARQADLNQDMARPSELRMVSITRLERAVADRLAAGQPVVESMLQLAGLTQIQYVFIYPEQGEIVIAGPAEGWKQTSAGETVGIESEHPTLQLDDLVTVLRTFSPEGMNIFGCSINPRQEGLKDLKQFVEASQAKGALDSRRTAAWAKRLGETLGRQDIEIYGVPAESRAARVIVEADYRMKLIGIGKLEPVANIPDYFELLAQNPAQATGAIDALRWWLTMKYENVLHADDHNAFEIRGSSVLCQSENQFLTEQGERVQTGQSEPTNRLFASNFTQHYNELAAVDPIFADMQNVFDLALVAALIRHERLDERLDWDRGAFATGGAYEPVRYTAPLECESVVNHRVFNGKDVVVQVAGGVQADLLAVVRDESTRQSSPRLAGVAASSRAPELPVGRWWWDAR
ncbi:MAG: DUF1598 domain-containing protein [Planctomycetaceae bacterium]|nr:DUF1598 domain-containing protein [Planctomycetaceae bacterium]